jgi:amphi-Trp domain-containing protein
MSQETRFKTAFLADAEKAAALLRELAQSLATGSLTLATSKEKLLLRPPKTRLRFEIRAEKDTDQSKLIVNIKWHVGQNKKSGLKIE